MTTSSISVRNLSVRYKTKESTVYAIEDVSFDLQHGRVLALVGESGAGKTTAGMSVLRLLPQEAEVMGGQILFEGENLLAMAEHELRSVR